MPAIPEEQTALRDQCTSFLTGHGPVTAAGLLASIPADTVPDRYGDGGAMTTADPDVQRVELSVGDATRALPPGQVRDIVTALAAG